MMNGTAGAVAVTLALGLIGACSGQAPNSSETVAPTVVGAPPATDATTLAPTTVTATTLAPTTTVAQQVFLRADGIGPFEIESLTNYPEVVAGARYDEVVAGIELAVVSDESREFPVEDIGAYFLDDGSMGYYFPFSRTVCWDDGGGAKLCAYFGGASAEAPLGMTGWDYVSSGPVGVLFTASGATINMLASDVPGLPLWDDDCGDTVEVYLDNIDTILATHNGDNFGVYSDVVRYTPAVPPPIDATVSYMHSGLLPYLTGPSKGCF